MLLTMSIITTKRSVFKKLERAAKTFQHFKNLLYLCALEYHKRTKDVKPFLSRTFLEKFVKGKEQLPDENEKIRKWKEELKRLWREEIGSDKLKLWLEQLLKNSKVF
jgi:transposase